MITELSFVSVWLALFAGLISFLSPCIFPLVPAYLAQLTGTNISDDKLNADKKLILFRSIGFITGFTIIFLLIGASSTFIGQAFASNRLVLQKLGGVIIIVFGLQMSGFISMRMLMLEKRFHLKTKKTTSFFRSILFGFVFGAGWSPCIGLALSSIFILASQTGSMFAGMFLLFIYSMGLGIPFIIVSLIYSTSIKKVKKVTHLIPIIQKVSGVIMIILGFMLYTGLFNRLSGYLARFIPFNF